MEREMSDGSELDLSWLDIAVLDIAVRAGSPGNEIITAHSPGWSEIGLDPPYLCDNVEYYEAPTESGLYRWSGYTLGSWGEGDAIVIKGGTWTPYHLAALSPQREDTGGYVLVPRVPSQAMLDAWSDAEDASEHPIEHHLNLTRWTAMLAAVPIEGHNT